MTEPRAPALRVSDLRKTYDNGVQALKGVSLDVAPGDFYALLGPNGAGKSTLIGIVSSLVNKSSGKVEVFGTDIDANRDGAMRFVLMRRPGDVFTSADVPAEAVMALLRDEGAVG